jgi:hypothetical protein
MRLNLASDIISRMRIDVQIVTYRQAIDTQKRKSRK